MLYSLFSAGTYGIAQVSNIIVILKTNNFFSYFNQILVRWNNLYL